MKERAIVVLYDPVSGDIVHGHYCEVDPGMELPSREELEKQALDHAQTHLKPGGFDPAKASILHVDPGTFRMDRAYRVDPKAKLLIEAKASH
jgi:hypothetical protein